MLDPRIPPDSTDYPDVKKNKEAYKEKFGKYPPKGYGPEDVVDAIQSGVALTERKDTDTSGDILSESSSWDDIFAYMDI